MHIFRKTLFLLSLFVAGFTSQAKAQISVMSFNIRLDASVDNENRWDNRKGEVAKMLTYYQPDLLGMQEVCPNQMADLKAALNGIYEGIGVGRDDGKAWRLFLERDTRTVRKEGLGRFLQPCLYLGDTERQKNRQAGGILQHPPRQRR